MSNQIAKAKYGILWSFINQGGNQIISLIVTFILARLITPSEFGIIGMMAVFTSFAAIIVDFGFSTALIQKKTVSKKDINTVFSINISLGIVLSVMFFLASPLIAAFYNEPILEILVKAISPIFIISSITGVNKALAFKELNIKLNSLIILSATIISSIVSIIMAYMGYGVWSILTKMIIDQSVISLLYLLFNPQKQRLNFSRESFVNLYKFGSNVAGDSILGYWTRNADNLLIGKFLGDSSLGIYSKSYALMMLPLRNITGVIAKVMFPSFSILQDDISQIKNIYLKTIRLIAFITFPMMTGLAILSRPFVLVAFGVNWSEMIPIISVLSLLGAIQSILSLNSVIFNSLGKSHIALRVTILMSLIYIFSFIIGIVVGELMGLVIAYTIAVCITAVPNLYIVGKQINVSVFQLFRNLANPFIGSVGMASGLILFKEYYYDVEKSFPIVDLIVLSGFGLLLYIIISFIFNFDELNMVKNILKK